MKKRIFAVLLTAILTTVFLCSCNMESSPTQGTQMPVPPAAVPHDSEKGETSTAETSITDTDKKKEQSFEEFSEQILTPPTEQSFAVSEPVLTPPTEISSEVSEPNDFGYTIDCIVGGIEVNLTDEQSDTLYQIADLAVGKGSYIENETMSREEAENARQNGIYIKIDINSEFAPIDTHTDDNISYLYLIIDTDSNTGFLTCNDNRKRVLFSDAIESIYKTLDYPSLIKSIYTAQNHTDLEMTTEVTKVTTEQLSAIPAKSTYAAIIDTLGAGANFGRSGLQLYKVDGTRLLVLNFDDLNDVCPLSGENLAKSAVSLEPPKTADQYLNRQDSTWYYGVMADKDFMYCDRDECGYCLSYTHMTYGISYADGTEAELSEINQMHRRVLVEIPTMLESYPPIAEVSQVILIDDDNIPDA